MAEKQALFGTDGFRAPYDQTTEQGGANAATFGNLAYAYATDLGDELGERPVVIVGGDTRRSGYELRQATICGAAAAGAEIWHVGITTTPVIAWLARRYGVGAVAVTASHNPDSDNGFKPFALGGDKYSAERLAHIEQRYRLLGNRPMAEHAPHHRIHHRVPLQKEYLDSMILRLGGPETLAGYTVALDCANGAALNLAPRLFESLGARVVPIACKADENDKINDNCGATHIDNLRSFIRGRSELLSQAGFLGGLAFDGDADRVMGMSPHGHELNGNHFMHMLADSDQRGIVGTVYTNTGLRRAVEARGVEFHECPNGDQHVTQRLQELTRERGKGYTRGGEPSGHLINTEHLSSGDGMYMGAWLLAKLVHQGATMDDLHEDLPLWPDSSHDIHIMGSEPKRIAESARVQALQSKLKELYPGSLHLVLRPSGTESKVRIWAESQEPELAGRAVEALTQAILTASAD